MKEKKSIKYLEATMCPPGAAQGLEINEHYDFKHNWELDLEEHFKGECFLCPAC